MIMSSKDSIKIFEKVVRETTERVYTMQRVSPTTIFFFNLLVLFFFFLVDDLYCQFDLVGFFVGVEFDEGFDIAVHDGGAGFGGVLRFDFLLGF